MVSSYVSGLPRAANFRRLLLLGITFVTCIGLGGERVTAGRDKGARDITSPGKGKKWLSWRVSLCLARLWWWWMLGNEETTATTTTTTISNTSTTCSVCAGRKEKGMRLFGGVFACVCVFVFVWTVAKNEEVE